MPSSFFDKNLLFILTILECIEKLKIYSGPYSTSQTLFTAAEQQPFNACCHLLLAVGEETKKIDEKLKDEFSFIEWEQVSGLRNRIAHDYRGIDPEVVFKIIKNELEVIKEAMISMLKITGITKYQFSEFLKSPVYCHLGYLEAYLADRIN